MILCIMEGLYIFINEENLRLVGPRLGHHNKQPTKNITRNVHPHQHPSVEDPNCQDFATSHPWYPYRTLLSRWKAAQSCIDAAAKLNRKWGASQRYRYPNRGERVPAGRGSQQEKSRENRQCRAECGQQLHQSQLRKLQLKDVNSLRLRLIRHFSFNFIHKMRGLSLQKSAPETEHDVPPGQSLTLFVQTIRNSSQLLRDSNSPRNSVLEEYEIEGDS